MVFEHAGLVPAVASVVCCIVRVFRVRSCVVDSRCSNIELVCVFPFETIFRGREGAAPPIRTKALLRVCFLGVRMVCSLVLRREFCVCWVVPGSATRPCVAKLFLVNLGGFRVAPGGLVDLAGTFCASVRPCVCACERAGFWTNRSASSDFVRTLRGVHIVYHGRWCAYRG